MLIALASVASVILSGGPLCETGVGQPCIDIRLTGIAEAREGDLVDMDIKIVAQQDDDATPGEWAGVEVVLGWDPTKLEPVTHSVCESPFNPYFLVMLFTSHDPLNLYYDCVNEDFDLDDWPDNDGDLSIIYFSPLGTEQNVFAIPQTLGTLTFRVLAPGNHSVWIIPSTDCYWSTGVPDDQPIPIETQILMGSNFNVTGDLTDTYEVEVRSAFDTEDPPGIGIEDFLAFLSAWAEQ